jgi:hypothetical protein
MKASEFRKLIREEIQNVLTEAKAKLGRSGTLEIESKNDGIRIYRYDYNNGTIAGQVFIPKDAVPDLINFLSKVK